MTRYAIVTDLNRCVGCNACSAACKSSNKVPIGSFWTKVLRIGPTPRYEGAVSPDVDLYFLPMQCQHCENPECVKVCPTGASYKAADGTVQIDKSKCIGCQFCVMACPYGVRYLNEEEGVVEKCTLCDQKIAQGELPQCVSQCVGRAKFFGDLDQGIDSFVGPGMEKILADKSGYLHSGISYEECMGGRMKIGDMAKPYTQADLHHLVDVGNKPSFIYILRNKKWQGGAE